VVLHPSRHNNGERKLHLTQQNHAFTNQKKCTTTQNKHKNYNVRLLAFYNIRPEKGAGLFSKEKIGIKGGDKEKVKKKG